MAERVLRAEGSQPRGEPEVRLGGTDAPPQLQ